MRHFLLVLELLFRRHERVNGESDFLGFEAFTRPNETDRSSTTSSSADEAMRKAA